VGYKTNKAIGRKCLGKEKLMSLST